MHPDSARELKARILGAAAHRSAASAAGDAGRRRPWPWVAVGPGAGGRRPGAPVAVRLHDGTPTASLLPDLGRRGRRGGRRPGDRPGAGPVLPRSGLVRPVELQQRRRPLRPGAVGRPPVRHGRHPGRLRPRAGAAGSPMLSNNHVLAGQRRRRGRATRSCSRAPADGGRPADRMATLAGVRPVPAPAERNLVDAAVAAAGRRRGAPNPATSPAGRSPAWCPRSLRRRSRRAGGEGRPHDRAHARAGSPRSRSTRVAVQYDEEVHRFDDQIEIQGLTGAFSAGGDSGSVIWRSRDRAPTGAAVRRQLRAADRAGPGSPSPTRWPTVLEALGAVWVAE